MKLVGMFAGAGVWLDYAGAPDLVIRWRLSSDEDEADALRVHGLVHALGGTGSIRREDSGWMEARIEYGQDLDDELVELIDLLCAARYAHPTMVQLPLALSDADAETLSRILGENGGKRETVAESS